MVELVVTRADPVERQLYLQQTAFGVDPPKLVGDAKAAFIRANVLAAIHELGELMDCYEWKPWAVADRKGARKRARSEALDEAADVFHFLLNLIGVEGWSWDEFIEAYHAKVDINFERVRTGKRGKMVA